MSNYRKSKQHIEVVQKQKNNTEIRCANQRKQLALMNTQIKNYKELLKECREEIDKAKSILTEDTTIDNTIVAHAILRKLLTKIDEVLK